MRDSAEPGVNGVTVTLLNCDGTPVTGPDGNPLTTTTGPAPAGQTPANDTSGNGFYQFTGLPDGCYTVSFDSSTATDANYRCGYTTTGAGDGTNDSKVTASADDPKVGSTGDVTVGADNRTSLTQDAGLLPCNAPDGPVIGDYVWGDANGNGIQDPDEPGINGVTVSLLDCDGSPVMGPDGTPVTTTTGPAAAGEVPANDPSAAGAYRFTGLPDGCYKVVFDPSTAEDENYRCGLTGQRSGDGTNDSAVDPDSRTSDPVELGSGLRIALTVDAGLVPCDGLATTGADLLPWFGGALALLLIGTAAVLYGRRRRNGATTTE